MPSLEDGINELRNPSSSTAQVAALKLLRNHVIGHVEKKESVVRLGAIEALENTLSSSVILRGKRKTQDTNGTRKGHDNPQFWSEDDEVRLQGIVLLGSLAHGGPEYTAPIFASSAMPTLAAYLEPRENPPKTILAALRTLIAIADSRAQEVSSNATASSSPLDHLYSKTAIQNFVGLLTQKSWSATAQTQSSLVCQLITKTISTDHQRHALVYAGVVDRLGEQIAAYFIHERMHMRKLNARAIPSIPETPSPQNLPHVLAAITSIACGSRYRLARLIYSPLVLEVFPMRHPAVSTEPVTQGAGYSTSQGGSPVDVPLPWIYGGSLKNENCFSKNFPALGSLQTTTKRSAMDILGEERANGTSDKGHARGLESSLVLWLIHVMRSSRRLCRIEAARLIVALYQAGFVDKSRAHILSMLVVPLLVGLVEETSFPLGASSGTTSSDLEARAVREQAPRILAGLLSDFPHLQKVATEASITHKVCQLFKNTFSTVDIMPGIWSPNDSSEDHANLPSSCRLGEKSLPAGIAHAMNCRESALVLAAALSEREDKYRKQLVDHGLVPRLIDSLTPLSENFLARINGQSAKEKLDASVGNTVPVLLAACKAARSMSRSVNLLRTSLLDAGLATPIQALLKHPNAEVVIAATDVICNIITEFSPMRSNLVDAGSIKVLCDHTHSADSRMRMVSLWALKHFVQQCPNEFKINCLEELGSGWLLQLITGSTSSASTNKTFHASQPSIGAAANAAGERVDILNNDILGASVSAAEDESMTDEPSTSNGHALSNSRTNHSQTPDTKADTRSSIANDPISYDTRLQAIKAVEDFEAASASTNLDLQIQVQVMDFLRNFIEGPGAADMIECLLNAVGSQQLFDLIASKLRTTAPSSTASNNTDPLNPPHTNTGPFTSALISSTLFTAVHVAAGAPKHRLQLLQQTALLNGVLPLFSHPDPRIRVTCCWLVSNLTWIDDANDAAGARQRAVELGAMGFEEKLKEAKRDKALDVRERAATAYENLLNLMEGRESAPGAARGGSAR